MHSPDPNCPSCDGTGQTFVDDCDSRGEHITRDMACDCWRPRDCEHEDDDEPGLGNAEVAWESRV